MPWGLKRFQNTGQSHFVTFCCYHRRPLFMTKASRRTFESALERVRRTLRLRIYGYVVTPEHFHLLISEPHQRTPSTVMQALKLGFARRVLAEERRRNRNQRELFEQLPRRIWQPRFYDFNVRSPRKRAEKLRYMHRNPVKRGLVASPEVWRWSSYRAYAFAEPGPVTVNNWEVLQLKVRAPAA